MGLKKLIFTLGLGAVVGALFAPKAGKTLRSDLKATSEEVRKEVAKKLARVERISKVAYKEVVADVLSYYKDAKRLTKEDADVLKFDLEAKWKEVLAELGEGGDAPRKKSRKGGR